MPHFGFNESKACTLELVKPGERTWQYDQYDKFVICVVACAIFKFLHHQNPSSKKTSHLITLSHKVTKAAWSRDPSLLELWFSEDTSGWHVIRVFLCLTRDFKLPGFNDIINWFKNIFGGKSLSKRRGRRTCPDMKEDTWSCSFWCCDTYALYHESNLAKMFGGALALWTPGPLRSLAELVIPVWSGMIRWLQGSFCQRMSSRKSWRIWMKPFDCTNYTRCKRKGPLKSHKITTQFNRTQRYIHTVGFKFKHLETTSSIARLSAPCKHWKVATSWQLRNSCLSQRLNCNRLQPLYTTHTTHFARDVEIKYALAEVWSWLISRFDCSLGCSNLAANVSLKTNVAQLT
jgi:hypothetical protein